MNDLKLGKLPAKEDIRTLKLASVLAVELPKAPPEWEFDKDNKVTIPLYMFGNDRYGDCVMAGRAHQTLRFEYVEQKKVIKISDSDVTGEYFSETGGADQGLVVLDSLKEWRTKGWKTDAGFWGFGRKTYTIHAFASINIKKQEEIKIAIYLFNGIGLGIEVYQSTMDQFDRGNFWDVVPNQGKYLGGHYIYIVGYNKVGPICVTWGKKQQMTWAFFDKYTDEAYAVIDERDSWLYDKSPVNTDTLEMYLEQVERMVAVE
jgi:hypothetical protein